MHCKRPTVLAFSGHDPSGGAGIHADIEAIISHECQPLSIITALTEQDTGNVRKLIPQQPDDIVSQAEMLMADIPVSAIKIGLLGNAGVAQAINRIISRHPQIPVVFDPVLAAGGGLDFSSNNLLEAINNCLLPHVTVLTPNSDEARKLTGLADLHDCGLALLDKGCHYVLITGTHESSPDVSNQLFHAGQCVKIYSWERLPYSYHGSGCTLAASIAALLARGLDLLEAIAQAQAYTWQSLASGNQPGKGQHIPNRLFWRDNE